MSTSLLPRNVSFSSLLDLPQTGLTNAIPQDKSPHASPEARTSPLARKPSTAGYAAESGAKSVKAALPSTIRGGRSVPPPEIDGSAKSLPLTFLSSPQAPRLSSPVQDYNGRKTADSSKPLPSRDATLTGNAFRPLGRGPQGGLAQFRGMDFTYVNDDNEAGGGGSLGSRSRQPSAATSFSDASSLSSLPFGPTLYNPATDPFADNRFGGGYGNSAFGSSLASTRRDSGYGVSPYVPSPQMGYGQMGRDGQPRRSQKVSCIRQASTIMLTRWPYFVDLANARSIQQSSERSRPLPGRAVPAASSLRRRVLSSK